MKLPIEYHWLRAHKFIGLLPWWFIAPSDQDYLRLEYQKETGDDIYPFAKRQDRDDIAGFKIIEGKVKSTVISVHLTWAGKREVDGFPLIKEYPDIFNWLTEEVVPETIDLMSEEDLLDIEKNIKKIGINTIDG